MNNDFGVHKIFLVDDHEVLLDGLKAVLDREEAYHVVGQAKDGEEALQKLRSLEVDILISDYSIPKLDGLSLVRLLNKEKPDLKIIILSMHREAHLVKEILKEDIAGYILKEDSTNELLTALDHVVRDKRYLSSEINNILIEAMQFKEDNRLFSRREREILKLIAEEYSSRQIAAELFISERTVETHRRNMMKKAKAHTTIGLLKFAADNNML